MFGDDTFCGWAYFAAAIRSFVNKQVTIDLPPSNVANQIARDEIRHLKEDDLS